jgi:hypothetical protein
LDDGTIEVRIVSVGPSPHEVAKVIRESARKRRETVTKKIPRVVATYMTDEDALNLREQLEGAGAKVILYEDGEPVFVREDFEKDWQGNPRYKFTSLASDGKCPRCGGTSFKAKRRASEKFALGLVFLPAAALAPKSLVRCETCGMEFVRG